MIPRRLILLGLALILLACSNASDEFNEPVPEIKSWSLALGNAQWESVTSTAVDNAGNLYFTGIFNDQFNFDPKGSETRTATGGDAYVVKFNRNGEFQWVKTYGGAGHDRGVTLAIQGTTLYLLGEMTGQVVFDNNNGTLNTGAADQIGIFLLKLDTDGNFLSVAPIAYATNNTSTVEFYYIGNFMRVGQQRIYLTGSFSGAVNFNPQVVSGDVRNANGTDIFQIKLNDNGAIQWAYTLGGPGYDMGHGVTIKSDGGPIFVGHIEGSVDLDPDPLVEDIFTAFNNPGTGGATDIFISRYTAAGTYVGSQLFGDVEDEWIYGVEADAQGNLYLAGLYQGSVDFDPGAADYIETSAAPLPDGYDVFLSKFDKDGNHQWTRSFGGNNSYYDWGLTLHVSGSGDIYVARCFYGNDSHLNSDNSQATWQSQGSGDVFLSKFLANGSYQWSKTFGSVDWDCATAVTSTSDRLYLAGKFSNKIDFADQETITATANSDDIFILKLDNPSP